MEESVKAGKYLILISLLVVGCASSLTKDMNLVSSNYEAVVFDDGISLEESKVIAQKELIKQNLVRFYDLAQPQIAKDVPSLPSRQDYWFISFEEKKPSSIPFIFTVVINKQTGSVKFANDYARGSQWILEAALLR